ncbi:AAA family ATPase, partial [Candidatus Woesearchaeota archaeon]|nr:AAA family ATPase [Candidatus Woesearchaeota archaeon]
MTKSQDIAIWTEKYRPKDFDEVKGQDEIVKRVEAFVKKKNMPHLLFAGPAGVGKTTLALVIARKLFGDSWHNNFLELNASDERGIDVIRVKVKDFARTRAIGDVPFKIIYLDECLDYNSQITVKSNNEVKSVKIGDFVINYNFNNYQILSINDNGEGIFIDISGVMKIPHQSNQGFYKIKIHDNELLATGNHEILTIDGWKRVDQLKIKDLVLCSQTKQKFQKITDSKEILVNYNLVGLSQEIKKKERYIAKSPEKQIIETLGQFPNGLSRTEITKKSKVSSSKITSVLSNKDNPYYIPLTKHKIVEKIGDRFRLSKNVSKSLDNFYRVKREKNNSNQEYILTQLRDKGLYPLKVDKAQICARLLGHLFSDGCLSLKTKQLFFSGKEEDLKEIKRDINKLGYYALGNIRHSRWKKGECWSFGAYKIELLSLFYSLGAPVGKKTDNIVKIPEWILNGEKTIKSEFLAALLGGDGYEPKFQGRTIKPITIGISKREDLKDNLIEYLNQLQQLFKDLGIETKHRICPGYKSIRKDKTKTVEGKIWITNSMDNIYNFLTQMGYRYCSYKNKTSIDVIRYLEWKKSLGKDVYRFRPIPYFKEWKEKLKLGDSAYYFVSSIEKIDDPEFVYCLSTKNQRFIANNVVAHNCDALTKDAQQALRRTMENYTQTCRFILSCVTPDTKILLPGNREVMVKEFINQYEHNTKQIHVQNISDNKESIKEDLVLAAVQLPASSIGKKVLEVTTMTGRKLKLTEDHRLLTINGWKEAGKMTKKDKLLIYPHIEGCEAENNQKKIIDLNQFIKFISHTEEQDGFQKIEEGSRFGRLNSKEKDKIINRIKGLRKIIKAGKGLTEREFEAYTYIKQNHEITRKRLQQKLGITRMGTNYLLPSLEKKGYIKRIVHKKTHSFVISDVEPIILRNDMHIKKIIEKEFNIKISYTAVQKSINTSIARGRIDRVIGELKRKELLDIIYDDTTKIGALARLCGFMLGDGHLVRNDIRLYFSGNKKALQEVQKDLDILNYSNYSKIKSVTLDNTIKGRKFRGTSTSFTLDSKPLSLLHQYLGVTKGDKTIIPYYVPEFIRNGTKYVKREFLRALFGCDADKPKWKQMNCGAISLRQNKAKFLRKEMLQYYGQLSNLFKDFDVDTYVNIRDKKELRTKDHIDVLCFELFITPNNKNLFKFFSKIGYAYEEYKNILTRLSSEYLRHKLYLIEALQEKSVLILQAVDNKGSIREIARKFEVSPDFVANQIKGKDVHLARKEFMSFEDWMKKYQYNDLLVINNVKDIKEIDEDIVMDLTCHKDHNFITNGLISHNCNYSSKIIDPI